MHKVKDTFGLSRVIEPAKAVPVNAWKLDNSKEIAANEARISVEIIHLERDNFQQICSDCGFDDNKVKAKILEIVEKRGKLHNPFTKTGGICYGEIEEMGGICKQLSSFKVGDKVICQTTMTTLPLYIEEITHIDYNYGEVFVKGYVIVFLGSKVFKPELDLPINYTMAVADEGGTLFNITDIINKGDKTMIIAKDLMTAVIYSQVIKKTIGFDSNIIIVLDIDSFGDLTHSQVKNILKKFGNSIYITDLTDPIHAFEEINKYEDEFVDLAINCEDITGSEVLCVLMTKNRGKVYFTSIKNGYSQLLFTAESVGKELETYSLDQYSEGYREYTFDLLEEIKEDLMEIDKVYETIENKLHDERKEQLIYNKKAGKTDDFIYASKNTSKLIDEILNISSYDCNVIIQGETGVGKEMVLGLIHKNSERNSMTCVKINCATIQENLAEAEFFGYEDGAFTGAKSGGKKGYFEVANGGILFLDEIGQLTPSLQSKLLRVLQENQFFRVGGVEPINVNVRVICANNIDLKQLIEEGKFREDLYYRLNICTINIPPLRERIEDIAILSVNFVDKYCKRYKVERQLDSGALQRLAKHDWPGNVRELENTIHRLIINTSEYVITTKDVESMLNQDTFNEFLVDIKSSIDKEMELDFNKIVESQEKKLIAYGLKKAGSTRKAADLLNMTQAQLMRKKQKYQL